MTREYSATQGREQVEITSPARASFHAPGQVVVSGRAVPTSAQAPIQDVIVEGQSVPLAADGTFTTTVVLGEGLNVITASATDARGTTGSAAVGVLAGEWAPLS